MWNHLIALAPLFGIGAAVMLLAGIAARGAEPLKGAVHFRSNEYARMESGILMIYRFRNLKHAKWWRRIHLNMNLNPSQYWDVHVGDSHDRLRYEKMLDEHRTWVAARTAMHR